jgi:integrase/recombinase XerD
MKLIEVVEHFLLDVNNRLADLTLKSYKQRLKLLVHFLADLCNIAELEQVTVLHLRQCVQHLSNNPIEEKHRVYVGNDGVVSISTVRSYIRVWKAFFNWCYQEELIDNNPVKRLKQPKEIKKIIPAFTQEHIEKMLSVCDTQDDEGFRNYVILLLLLDTGMRISELAQLSVADVNFQSCYIKVFGKGRKEREIGIYPEMSKLLWKYVHKYRKPKDPNETILFIGRKGALSAIGIHDVIKRIQKLSGLTDIKLSAHVFRHTFAKMYLDSGGEIFKLSREMGHSSIQVTKIYLEDFGSSEARREHNVHSPLMGIEFKKQRKVRRKTE